MQKGFGIPISLAASAAQQRARGALKVLEDSTPSNCDRCLCVLLCHPMASAGSASARGPATGASREYCIKNPRQLLLAYIVWYQQLPEDRLTDSLALVPNEASDEKDRRKKRLARQQREYARVRDPLVKVALQSLEKVAIGTMSTVLLPTTSVEAESVVSLYLLGGGGSRVQRPPGVDPREALGGVVVQRIENQPLFKEFMGLGQEADGTNFQVGSIGRTLSGMAQDSNAWMARAHPLRRSCSRLLKTASTRSDA
jgi:hypothetical protein